MKKKILIVVSVLLLLGLVVCIIYSFNRPSTLPDKEKNLTIDEQVSKTISKMSIDEKIAQMLVLYYTKDTVDSNLEDIVTNVKPGGFILMKENITTFDKTRNFVSKLQELSEILMIISIDQEGGMVQRLRNLTDAQPTNIPNMYSLGNTNDTALAKMVGKVMAEELRTIGVNVVYAPVVDIYSNPDNTVIGTRSFGKDEKIVSTMALSLARGLEENGVIPTFKHFPGHGDTSVDSHKQLPIIDKSYEDLTNLELVPFKDAIESGAKIVMIGHIAFPGVTNDNTPASLSKKIITDILKTDLGYNGLVITDALNMGALTNTYSDEEIYTKAINAGVDLLLMPNGSKKAIEYIKANISEDRIDESVKKILTFKYTYLDKYKLLDKSYLGSDSHKEIIDKIK